MHIVIHCFKMTVQLDVRNGAHAAPLPQVRANAKGDAVRLYLLKRGTILAQIATNELTFPLKLLRGATAGLPLGNRRPDSISSAMKVTDGSQPRSASIFPIHPQQSPPQSPESGSSVLSKGRPQRVHLERGVGICRLYLSHHDLQEGAAGPAPGSTARSCGSHTLSGDSR